MIHRYCMLRIAVVAFALPCLHADRNDVGDHRILQGPMLGAPEPTTLRIWTRANGPYTVSVEYGRSPHLRDAQVSAVTTASAQADFTTVTLLEHLEPDTTYYYRILVDGRSPKYLRNKPAFRARTAPDSPARFSVGFGSCARYGEDPVQPIWQQVATERPDLFLWLGDNIYADTILPEMIAEEYRRQRDVVSLQPVLRSIPQLAVWDDHDYGLNDHDRENPIKADALRIFKNYWANPAYGLPDTPGVFFRYRYGGVDFFFLDGRYHRAPYFEADGPTKTFLGAAQLRWLKNELRRSDASFKVLACGSGWTSQKGAEGDSWATALQERDALFAFIREQDITGVVLLSGDTHRGELFAIPESQHGGYDLYELVSSPLAQEPDDGERRARMREVTMRPPYLGGSNFGLLSFDMTASDPTLTFELINHFGDKPWPAFVIRASELRNGRETWTGKIGRKARAWYDANQPES